MIYVQRKKQKRKIHKDMLNAYLERDWIVVGSSEIESVDKKKPKKVKSGD